VAEANEKISPRLQKSGSAMPVWPKASTPMARAAGGDQEKGPDWAAQQKADKHRLSHLVDRQRR
jgi:hypothetical protein